MNDPNGMFYDPGTQLYHLYFQYNPEGNKWGHMSWGHAVSKNRLDWQEEPVAIPEYNGIMIFSGSALMAKNENGNDEVLAFYTAMVEDSGKQEQALAISNDGGLTFTQFAGNPLIDIGSTNFRDPKVYWFESFQKYIMTVVRSDIHKVQFYASEDPKKWSNTPVGEFGPQAAVGGVWECPDLFELQVQGSDEKKWVLLVNINPGGPFGGSAMQYFVGDFDGEKFTNSQNATEALWLDHGHDFYAAVTWNGDKHTNEKVILGWASNWMYAGDVPTTPWKGVMTLPRELSLIKRYNGDYRLSNYPISALDSKFPKTITIAEHTLSIKQINQLIWQKVGRQNVMIIDFKTTSYAGFNISVLSTDPMSTLKLMNTHIGCYNSFCTIDRSRSGNCDFNSKFCAPASMQIGPGLIDVRIVIDVSIIEVYICEEDHFCSSFTESVFSQDDQNLFCFQETPVPSTLHILSVQLPDDSTLSE